MPRMQILTASEHKAFDAPPVFSYAERDTFFQVSERLDAILATLRSPTNRVSLVLTIGYFRATKRFFNSPIDSVVYLDLTDNAGVVECGKMSLFHPRGGGPHHDIQPGVLPTPIGCARVDPPHHPGRVA